MDNDVNTLVLSEQLFNGNEDTSNCLFVNGWDGVGSSVIINGILLRGATNSVGEIGHMIVEPSGRKCTCGKDGCVEAYCTAEALCESTRESIRRGRKTSLNDCANGHIKSITCADILRCYEQGDQLCTEQVQNVARYLSICLSNTINLLNPNTLIFAGEMVEYSDLFFQTVREYTNELLISPSDQSVTFIRRSINDKYYVYGSISLVYAAFFMAEVNELFLDLLVSEDLSTEAYYVSRYGDFIGTRMSVAPYSRVESDTSTILQFSFVRRGLATDAYHLFIAPRESEWLNTHQSVYSVVRPIRDNDHVYGVLEISQNVEVLRGLIKIDDYQDQYNVFLLDESGSRVLQYGEGELPELPNAMRTAAVSNAQLLRIIETLIIVISPFVNPLSQDAVTAPAI